MLNKCSVKFKNNYIDSNLERVAFDNSVKEELNKIISKRNKLPSISAIYRVKNGASSIELSVMSLAPICKEIIIVDNNSSDSTVDIINKLKVKLKDICNVEIYSYSENLTVAGPNYKCDIKGNSGLADFYNYCFSKGTSNYVMKADSHLIYTFNGLKKIQKKLKRNPRFIMFKGVEIFGKNLASEIYIFKQDGNYVYVDGDNYEDLKFNKTPTFFERITNRIIEPVFIHHKRLSYVFINAKENLANELYK